MKGHTGSTLSSTKYVKCFSVETSCYVPLLLTGTSTKTKLHRLNFIVTVKLLYDQVESDFVHCQTKMWAFASRICSEFKQIELNLNWNRLVRQNALWSLVFSSTRPWNKQISAPDAGQPSSQEWWQVADLKHLKNSYIFSLPRISTKDFPYIKEKIDWSIGINYSSVDFKWTQVFLVASRLIAEVNEFFGSYRISLNQRVSLWYGWELRWIELGCVRRPTSQEMK